MRCLGIVVEAHFTSYLVPLMCYMCGIVAVRLCDVNIAPVIFSEQEEVRFVTPVAESAYLLEVDPVAKDGVWEEFCSGELFQVNLEEGMRVSDMCWNHLVKFFIVEAKEVVKNVIDKQTANNHDVGLWQHN